MPKLNNKCVGQEEPSSSSASVAAVAKRESPQNTIILHIATGNWYNQGRRGGIPGRLPPPLPPSTNSSTKHETFLFFRSRRDSLWYTAATAFYVSLDHVRGAYRGTTDDGGRPKREGERERWGRSSGKSLKTSSSVSLSSGSFVFVDPLLLFLYFSSRVIIVIQFTSSSFQWIRWIEQHRMSDTGPCLMFAYLFFCLYDPRRSSM